MNMKSTKRAAIVFAALVTVTGCKTLQDIKDSTVGDKAAKKELSFIDFCKNPSLSGSEKLMKYLHPDANESCEDAKERLSKVTNINLKRLEIKDLRAISVFKNVKLMSLSYNPVTDLSPLRGFDNLQVLFLRHIALGDTVAKTEKNCPTDEGMFKSIREFCAKK